MYLLMDQLPLQLLELDNNTINYEKVTMIEF